MLKFFFFVFQGSEYTDLWGVDELQDVEIGQRIDYVSEFELCRSTEQVNSIPNNSSKLSKQVFSYLFQ